MPEIRVTIDEKLNVLLNEVVASGLYPSKAELMRSGLIRLIKDLGLLQNLMNTNKKAGNI